MEGMTSMSSWTQAPSLKNRRILVVEDEYMIADDMVLDFKLFGAEVVGPVPNVKAALACLEKDNIDGAVLDINLQGEMVFPLADELRAKGVPFVFATGYQRRSIPAAYVEVTLCGKPLEAAKIARALFG